MVTAFNLWWQNGRIPPPPKYFIHSRWPSVLQQSFASLFRFRNFPESSWLVFPFIPVCPVPSRLKEPELIKWLSHWPFGLEFMKPVTLSMEAGLPEVLTQKTFAPSFVNSSQIGMGMPLSLSIFGAQSCKEVTKFRFQSKEEVLRDRLTQKNRHWACNRSIVFWP